MSESVCNRLISIFYVKLKDVNSMRIEKTQRNSLLKIPRQWMDMLLVNCIHSILLKYKLVKIEI